ncbi:hypothetical protein NC651_031610 [Populus alba x Populus x berolinensis]|nr:hypothetical protein NC651_031610 [Populus alba x Populus x berolinensis]
MDEGMQQFQQSLVVENDKERNGNREALTALRKRAKTTKTSIKSPFGSRAAPLVKDICGTCGNHDEKEKTWIMFLGSVVFTSINFMSNYLLCWFNERNMFWNKRQWQFLESCVCCDADQEQIEYEAKNLQSFVKEKSILNSEKGVLADSISQRLLGSSVTLTDKPKPASLLGSMTSAELPKKHQKGDAIGS